jgi:hypothetical protein
MKMLLTAALCIIGSASTADIGDDLVIQSALKLKDAITQNLNFATTNCKLGKLSSCQDALLDQAELNNVDSEVALRRLRQTVRSHDTGELIDDALSKLDDVHSAIEEIQEASSVPTLKGTTRLSY